MSALALHETLSRLRAARIAASRCETPTVEGSVEESIEGSVEKPVEGSVEAAGAPMPVATRLKMPIATFGTDKVPVSYRTKPSHAGSFFVNTKLLERGPAIHTTDAEPVSKVFNAVAHEVGAHTLAPIFDWPVHTTAEALAEVQARVSEHTHETPSLRVDVDMHRAHSLEELYGLEETLECLEASFEAAESMETKETLVDEWSKTMTSVLREASVWGVLPPAPRVSMVAKLATAKLPFARHLQMLVSGPLKDGFTRFERVVASFGESMDVESEWELRSNVLDLRHYMDHVAEALKIALEAEKAGLPATEIPEETSRYLKHVNETLVAHGKTPLMEWTPNMTPRCNPFRPQETEVRPGKEVVRGRGGSGGIYGGFEPEADEEYQNKAVKEAVARGSNMLKQLLDGTNFEFGKTLGEYMNYILRWYQSPEAKAYFERKAADMKGKSGDEYLSISRQNFEITARSYIAIFNEEKKAKEAFVTVASQNENSDAVKRYRAAIEAHTAAKNNLDVALKAYNQKREELADSEDVVGKKTQKTTFKEIYNRYKNALEEWRNEVKKELSEDRKPDIDKFILAENDALFSPYASKSSPVDRFRNDLTMPRVEPPPMFSDKKNRFVQFVRDALKMQSQAINVAKKAVSDTAATLRNAHKDMMRPYKREDNQVDPESAIRWSVYDEYEFRLWCNARYMDKKEEVVYWQRPFFKNGEEMSYFDVLTSQTYMDNTPMHKGGSRSGRYSWGVATQQRKIPGGNDKGVLAFSFLRDWPKVEGGLWGTQNADGMVSNEPVLTEGSLLSMRVRDPQREGHPAGTFLMKGQGPNGGPFDENKKFDFGNVGFDDTEPYVPFTAWGKEDLTEDAIQAMLAIFDATNRTDNARAVLKNAQTEFYLWYIGKENVYIKTQSIKVGRATEMQNREQSSVRLPSGSEPGLLPFSPMTADAVTDSRSDPPPVRGTSNTTVLSDADADAADAAVNLTDLFDDDDQADEASSSGGGLNRPSRSGLKSNEDVRLQKEFTEIMEQLSRNAARYGASLDHWRKIISVVETHTPQAYVRNRLRIQGGLLYPELEPDDAGDPTPILIQSKGLFRFYTDPPLYPSDDEIFASGLRLLGYDETLQTGTIELQSGLNESGHRVYEFYNQAGQKRSITIPPYAIVTNDTNGHVHMMVGILYRYHQDLFAKMLKLLRNYRYEALKGDVRAREQDPTDNVYGQSTAVGAKGIADRMSWTDEDNNQLPTRRVSVKLIRGGNTLPETADGMVFQYYDGSDWIPVIGFVPYMWDADREVWVTRNYDYETGLWRSATWQPSNNVPMLSVEAAKIFPTAVLEFDDPNSDIPEFMTPEYSEALEWEAVELNGTKWYPHAPPNADPRVKFSDNRYYGLRDHETGAWRMHYSALYGSIALSNAMSDETQFGRNFTVVDGQEGGVVNSMILQEELEWINQARKAHTPYYRLRLPDTLNKPTAVEKHLLRMWQESNPLALGARNRELYSVTELVEIRDGDLEPIRFKMSNERAREIGLVYSNDPRVSPPALRGEPPANDGTLSLFWVVPKPESGAYRFKDADGKDTGVYVAWKNCFGVWDPLQAKWRLYPERLIVDSRNRVAPFGEGYGTYPGEPPGKEQLWDEGEYEFDYATLDQQSFYNGTALESVLKNNSGLGISDPGWGVIFEGGTEALDKPRKGKILSHTEELVYAPAARVRYYTPLLRHLRYDPGVLAAWRGMLDQRGNARDMVIPLEFYDLGTTGAAIPDLCRAFCAPHTLKDYVAGNREWLKPFAELNQTNNVLIFPLDPNLNYLRAPASAGFLRSERQRDEFMTGQNFSRTLVGPKWLAKPRRFRPGQVPSQSTTYPTARVRPAGDPNNPDDKFRQQFAIDPVNARKMARRSNYTIPDWAEPRVLDADSKNRLTILSMRDRKAFKQALMEYGLDTDTDVDDMDDA